MMSKYEVVVGGDVENVCASEGKARHIAGTRVLGLTAYAGSPQTVYVKKDGEEIGHYTGRITAEWTRSEPLERTG